MNGRSLASSAFSLVELTLALGVAAFALITILGMLPAGLKTQQTSVQQTAANEIISQILADLRADVRLPPGQASKENNQGFGLSGHWLAVAQPDTLYFTNQPLYISGSLNQSTAPVGATFRAKITYLLPPTATTSLADVTVSWPAQVDPATGTPAGLIETLIAVNRQ